MNEPDDFDLLAAHFLRDATTWPLQQAAIAALLRKTVADEKLRIADRVSRMDNGCGAAYIAERIRTL